MLGKSFVILHLNWLQQKFGYRESFDFTAVWKSESESIVQHGIAFYSSTVYRLPARWVASRIINWQFLFESSFKIIAYVNSVRECSPEFGWIIRPNLNFTWIPPSKIAAIGVRFSLSASAFDQGLPVLLAFVWQRTELPLRVTCLHLINRIDSIEPMQSAFEHSACLKWISFN